MRIRKTVALLMLIGLGGISPALADCCSSFLDCAAAVVTDGLSCEIETIISTIKTLVTLTSNLLSDINGQTQTAENAARQAVTNLYNTLQSESQRASADLAQAKAQADQLYHDESALLPAQGTTAAGAGAMQAVSPAAPSSPGPNTSQPTAVRTQNTPSAAQSVPAQSGAALRGVTAQRTTAVAAPPSNGTAVKPGPQQSMAAFNSKDAVSIESGRAPHGQFTDAFSRGQKLINTLNSTGAADFAKINQSLANAMASEGSGVTAADIIGAAMRAPLTDIESQLSSMLANPLSAFDPSGAVDSMENSITASLSTNVATMVDDITAGPAQAFGQARPSYEELYVSAEKARAVSAAMAQLYELRTSAAAAELYALLPAPSYASQVTRVSASTQIAAGSGQRVSFATISANFAASKQKIIVAVRPLNVAPIHAAIAQLKAQRAQGKSAQAPSMVATYRSSSTRQLDSYFAGKSPAAMASQRDQLIAQARAKFANDQKTQNGVIALINSEAQKQGALATTAVPHQGVPGMATGVATSSVAAIAAKPAWGTTPAWTPPTAPHAVTAIKPSPIAIKTIQPVQRPAQLPAAVQAPSSMPTNQ